MPVQFDRSTEPGVVRLEGEIDIAVAAELKQALVEALAAAPGARISIEKATGIDITTVQLLWAAGRAARATGATMTLEGPVPAALDALVQEAGFRKTPWADASEAEGGGR